MRKGAVWAAGMVLLVLLASCGSSSDTAGTAAATAGRPDKATVIIRDIAFKQDEITVKVGETVTWRFADQGIPHDVVADDGSFKSDVQDSGAYRHTFDAPGAYSYKCSLHPGQMKGTIAVR